MAQGSPIKQFLPANTGFNLYIFDSATNRTSITAGATGASGTATNRTVKVNQIGGRRLRR